MSWPSRLKILFCIQIFFGFCNAIVSNEEIFKNMSPEEKKSFFGIEDGPIPEFEVVEIKEPPRSKRGTQEPLKITFNYMDVPTVAILNVVEDHELFSPTGSGIWFAESNPNAYHNVIYTPKPDIFDRIGNYEFFQNLGDCSAITKFWTADGHVSMSGVLKQDYGVRTVPLGWEEGYFNIRHKRSNVKRRSANSTADQDENSSILLVIYKLPEIPREYYQNPKNSSFLNLDLHRKRRQNADPFNPPNIVYPKLLISPDFRVISSEKTVEESVQQLIAHFNAVDMMYRQVTSPQIRLKIGGLIIPRDHYATPYIGQNTEITPDVNADDVLTYAQNYFTDETHRFQYETYSAILIMTTGTVWTGDGTGQLYRSAGYGMIATACHNGRAVVKFRKGFQGVTLAAHEMAHVFSARHDDDGVSSPCSRDGGFAMTANAAWGKRLRWSRCSLQAFYDYLRSPDASCMHTRPDDKPDAIKSMQGAWLSLTGQCRNLQKDADGICVKSRETCSEIACRKGKRCFKINMTPMEGSLGEVRRVEGKRCINKMWVDV